MSITIKSLAEDSPLHLAGLETGDAITHVNVWPVSDARSFEKGMQYRENKIKYQRGGEVNQVTVEGYNLKATAITESGDEFQLSIATEPKAEVENSLGSPKEPSSGSASMMSLIAWCLFLISFVGGLVVLSNYGQIEVMRETHYNTWVWVTVVSSWLASGFLVAFSYVLRKMSNNMSNIETLLAKNLKTEN